MAPNTPSLLIFGILITVAISITPAREEILKSTLLNLTEDNQCVTNHFLIEQYLINLKEHNIHAQTPRINR